MSGIRRSFARRAISASDSLGSKFPVEAKAAILRKQSVKVIGSNPAEAAAP
jgi:hypothetical protein